MPFAARSGRSSGRCCTRGWTPPPGQMSAAGRCWLPPTRGWRRQRAAAPRSRWVGTTLAPGTAWLDALVVADAGRFSAPCRCHSSQCTPLRLLKPPQDGQPPRGHTPATPSGSSGRPSPHGLGPGAEGPGSRSGQGSPAGSVELLDAEEEFAEAMRQVRGLMCVEGTRCAVSRWLCSAACMWMPKSCCPAAMG